MANVRNAINELKTQQDELQGKIEEMDDKIKAAQAQNYEVCLAAPTRHTNPYSD